MKRENLTWAELWPLVCDGQLFDSRDVFGGPFKYFNGELCSFHGGMWQRCTPGNGFTKQKFYLVDDPSKPKPQDATKLDAELEAHAKQIFEILESWHHTNDQSKWERNMQMHVLTKGLVSMMCLVYADTMREIEKVKE